MFGESVGRVRGTEEGRRVSGRLRKLAPLHGLLRLDDILVSRGGVTARLDHVVLDRLGLLVIETRARSGAVLKGAEDDVLWTACYPGGRRDRFPNPLEQNARHVEVLRQALRDQPLDLSSDAVGGAVVFTGGRVDTLDLASARGSVVQLRDLERLFHLRYANGPRTPILTPEQMVRAFSVLTALDRSHDSHLVAREVKATCRIPSAPLARVG
jgi:hypothetical protein